MAPSEGAVSAKRRGHPLTARLGARLVRTESTINAFPISSLSSPGYQGNRSH